VKISRVSDEQPLLIALPKIMSVFMIVFYVSTHNMSNLKKSNLNEEDLEIELVS
jgi:hypothetical protein